MNFNPKREECCNDLQLITGLFFVPWVMDELSLFICIPFGGGLDRVADWIIQTRMHYSPR